MTLSEATSRYWRWSQHFVALQTADDREAFLMFTVGPTIATCTCPHQRKLLQRLMTRPLEPQRATA